MGVLSDPAVGLLVTLNAAVLAWFVVTELRSALRTPAENPATPSGEREIEELLLGGDEPGDGMDLPPAAVDCRGERAAPHPREGR